MIMKAKGFMKQSEGKEEKKRYVIEKIRRISVAMDRSESWTVILLIGLFTLMVLGLVYYFML